MNRPNDKQDNSTQPAVPSEPSFLAIPDGMVNAQVPPLFLAKMTGVAMAEQNNKGDVKLTYTDHSEETARLPYAIADEDNFFKIVSDTQEASKALAE